MARPPFQASRQLKPLLAIVGSVIILVHFGLVGVRALATPSGPWPGPEGMGMMPPPLFAQVMDEETARPYLRVLQLAQSHASSGPAVPGVFLEISLKDEGGQEQKLLRFPDPEANAAMRYRQELLARQLVPDQPLAPLPGEYVPAPGQPVRTVPIWDIESDGRLRLRETPEHLIPRNRPVFGPSAWSLLLVRSYARYLCRTQGAASVEVIRHSRDAIAANAFLMDEPPPPAAFQDLVASYGSFTGD
jgi:hypothetical protein